ncbi:MAG: D-sedoheptulose 7-phosphate isomerase [Candidatus Aureabacteria bacterium]|nr:D-sedoheptulose 7-phosphate isomerase [Candidatus Auribacterota bacterium]
MHDYIVKEINASVKIKEACLDKKIVSLIQKTAEILIDVFKNGHKLLLFGNGGSAADAQHIAAELVGRYKMERRSFPAMALTCNSSNMTAISNDYGFEAVFVRQVEALGVKGDAALGISTSGNSPNVIAALKQAKRNGMIPLGLTGSQPCKMDPICQQVIHVPSTDTPRIQECHILIGHILCGLVEQSI